MNILIINNHTKHIDALVKIFPKAIVISREEVNSVVIDEFDLIIITGGYKVPTVVNHNEVYSEEENIVRSGKAVIGICLGCEIICKTFGGEVAFMDKKESGEKKFVVKDLSLENAIGSRIITSYESHLVYIKKIPNHFRVLIESEHAPEMIRHESLPIIGIQFHPEVEAPKQFWDWIISELG